MQGWYRSVFTLVLAAGLLLASLAAAAQSRQVTVQKATLRQTPQVFGKIVATLSYGTQVELIEAKGGWLKVRSAAGSGWLHETAVAKRTAPLTAGSQRAGVAASQQELTLAGKGFNQQVESAYRQKNRGLDYAWIDRMEKQTLDEAQLRRFLVDGKLGGADVR